MKMNFNPGEGGDEASEFAHELASAFSAAMGRHSKPKQVGKTVELDVAPN